MHDRRPQQRHDEHDDRHEGQVDEKDAGVARHVKASEPAHQRVEHQGEKAGDEEDEDHLADGAEGEPDDQQQNRQRGELHPAGDEDPAWSGLGGA